MPTRRLRGRLLLLLVAASLTACNVHQSALAPFGEEADTVRRIAIVMLVGAVMIGAGVAALMVAAVRAKPERLTHTGGMRLVGWLGGVIPTIVLLALLVWTLPAMRPRAVSPADLRIAVEGEQFWWRVAYRPPGARAVETANEIRLPVGRTVRFDLTAKDVVHSLWIPGLAGKMDMIPGRTNHLVVRATRAGRYRGVCTEFCGLSHALMAFDVIAMEPAAFDAWLAAQRRPATASNALFASHGCGGCHAIRGTDEAGRIGPDLTHFGARTTLAAGVLPMTPANVAAFVRDPHATKPGARMPSFKHMPPAEAQAIARFLVTLK